MRHGLYKIFTEVPAANRHDCTGNYNKYNTLVWYNEVMKYVLAISGGVDSVVLLDMVTKQLLQAPSLQDCVVAHFDHGIRAESGRDAEFVWQLAEKYNLPFVLGKAKLGRNTSEEVARKKRYESLRSIASSELAKDAAGAAPAKIVTAHHQDDLIETILINLIRGTGWRGLAPFWSSDIVRPLIGKSKAELVEYAIKNNLEWVEDETNFSSKYLRNRVRDFAQKISPQQRKKLLGLHVAQAKHRTEIECILEHISSILGSDPNIDIVNDLPDGVAVEVLNKIADGRLTTPQIKRLLRFLHTAKSGDISQPGGGLQVAIYRGNMTIAPLSKHPTRHKEVK
ncbi:hypothetical protein FACS189431_2740 [Alphaproteobacteria bacterium]|nr:hypothetical protein FACS189431_2740 [Alphaproteobacteria bacterium]